MGEIQWKQALTNFSPLTLHTNNGTTVKTQNGLICMALSDFNSPAAKLSLRFLILSLQNNVW